jgi:tetratricopeptide (TPR) repeat protein
LSASRVSRVVRMPLAAAALAAAALVAALLFATGSPDPPQATPAATGLPASRVLIMDLDFREPAHGGGDAVVARMATDWIAQGLTRTGMLQVVSGRIRLADQARADAGPAALAAAAGAGSILTGTIYRQDDGLVFQVRIADGTGALRGAIEYGAPAGEPIQESLERLRQRVMGALAAIVDPRLSSWAAVSGAPPSFEAYQHYIEGIERYAGGSMLTGATPARALRDAAGSFRRAFDLDTTFTAALVWAVLARRAAGPPDAADELLAALQARRDTLPPWERHMTDFLMASHARDWEAGYQAMRQVNELTPGGEWAFLLASTALWTGRPRTVLTALDRIDPERYFRMPTWGPYCSFLLNALQSLGENDRALAEVERCRRLEPDNRNHTYSEAVILAALGRGADAAATAERALAEPAPPQFKVRAITGPVNRLHLHGHAAAAERVAARAIAWYDLELSADERAAVHPVFWAQLLYAAGRYDRARQILLAAPDDQLAVESLGALALAEAMLGNRDEAGRVRDRMEGLDLPWQGAALRALYRVRLAGLLHGPDQTVRTLADAWDSGELQRIVALPLGLRELQHLRAHPGFQTLVRPRD